MPARIFRLPFPRLASLFDHPELSQLCSSRMVRNSYFYLWPEFLTSFILRYLNVSYSAGKIGR